MRCDYSRGGGDPRWYVLAGRVALVLWDWDAWDDLAVRQIQTQRDRGLLTLLPVALAFRAWMSLHAGRFRDADALLEEARQITEAVSATLPGLRDGVGGRHVGSIEPVLAAYRGDKTRTLELVRANTADAAMHAEGQTPMVHFAASILHIGLGEYPEAVDVVEGRALSIVRLDGVVGSDWRWVWLCTNLIRRSYREIPGTPPSWRCDRHCQTTATFVTAPPADVRTTPRTKSTIGTHRRRINDWSHPSNLGIDQGPTRGFHGARSRIDARGWSRTCSDGQAWQEETDVAQQRALPMTPWVARASAVNVVRPGPNVRGRAQRSDVAVGGDQIVTALIAASEREGGDALRSGTTGHEC